MKDSQQEKLLTAKQVGELLGVSSRSVLRWIQCGKLEGMQFGPRQYRVSKEALEEFLKESKAKICQWR